MGYNLRDRSAVKRKLTPELEPEPEVKKPRAKRQRTSKENKKVDTDEPLPPSATSKSKTKAIPAKKTSTSTVQVSPRDRIPNATEAHRSNDDAISIRSSSPVLESEPHGEIGPVERVLNTA